MPEVWETRTYYDLLEVSRDASQDEIRFAFRLQSHAWAPDKMPAVFEDAATRRLRALVAANVELSDPVKRKKYDASLGPANVPLETFPDMLQNVAAVWKRMAGWMKAQDVGRPFDRNMAFTAGDYLERGRQPSEKQRPHMLAAWDLAVSEGFDPEATDE